MTDNRSRPSDRRTELEAQHRRVSERIERLEEAIGDLDGAATLRPDAAARLASYRHSHERRLFELGRLEWEMRAHPALKPDSPVVGAPDDGRPAPTVADEMLKQAGNKKKKRLGWLRS
jgi:hypothetical protein